MFKEGLPEEYKKELEETGKIHIPHNPPKATTPAQTDELLKMPDNIKNRLDKYLSILNESDGALVPRIYAEIKKQKDKNPNIKYNFWEVLEGITQGQPDALAILKRARESLKRFEINERQLAHPAPQFKKYGLLNDKVTHDIICAPYDDANIDGQLYWTFKTDQASEEERKAGQTVIVTTALSYEGTEPLTSKKITGYDRAVYNAVSTIYYYHCLNYPGEPCIVSPQEIWRVMNGIKDQSIKPSPAQIKKVCSSIDKMRFTRIFLDITEELKKSRIKFNDERVINGVIDTYYLQAERGIFKTEKGREIDAYKFEKEPILYSYNAAKDHIIFVSHELLNTTTTTGNEGDTIAFREYLLYQIMLMYNKVRNSNRILFETLYEKTGIEKPEDRINRAKYSTENAYKTGIKKEAAKDREKVFEILEAWKGKGFIKDYKQVGQRPIIGADIFLMPKLPQITAGE